MKSKLESYNYPRKYLFIEDENNSIKVNIEDDELISNINYQWTLVNSIKRKKYKNKIYDLIQHDDKEIGWIELRESVQVFRFPAAHCKIIEDNFFDNKINEKMNKTRNYRALFKGKMLSARCEIIYNDERYYGIFLNKQFQGFHHENVLDFIFECNKEIDFDANKMKLFKISNLTIPVSIKSNVKKMLLVSAFPKLGVGKVKIETQKQPLWVSLSNINEKIKSDNFSYSKEEKILNDIFEYIHLEREKSKEISDKVLEVRDYLKKLN